MKNIFTVPLLLSVVLFISCSKPKTTVTENSTSTQSGEAANTQSAKVTFVELGSVKCIPCRQMQPVMKSIEEKYKGQVKVVFHDVWKDKAPAQEYGIKLIPTQVFLDEYGKEFFRHEGFYPEAEIDKLMESKGLTIPK